MGNGCISGLRMCLKRSQARLALLGKWELVPKVAHRLCLPKERLLELEQRKVKVPQPDAGTLVGSSTLEGGESAPKFPWGPHLHTSRSRAAISKSACLLLTNTERHEAEGVCVCVCVCLALKSSTACVTECVRDLCN